MAVSVPRGQTDEVIDQIVAALGRYEADHPHARIDVYRQNPVSVRVRIVDPDFAGQGRPQRNDYAWSYLDALPDETLSDISTMLLLTPDETARSFANVEFDHPVQSNL
jgi:hypothetical protein